MKKIHLEIQKADGMQGFAAYQVSGARSKRKVILLNVYASLASAVEYSRNKKELTNEVKVIMITNLMHEFGHVMEEWFGREFNEEFVEGIVDSYMEKYSGKSYEDTHGDQTI